MLTRESLLAEIEAFLTETGTPPTTFGKAAVGDPNLVFDLRDGTKRDLLLGTANRIIDFMAQRRREAKAANGAVA